MLIAVPVFVMALLLLVLQETLGNGAMSNSIADIEDSDCLLVFGYNCADSHPIVARRVVKAKQKKGPKLLFVIPVKIETAKIANQYLPLKNGTNMALVNAFAYTLIDEDLYDKRICESLHRRF